MALFNCYDIAELKAVQSAKRLEQFTNRYSEEISAEMDRLENKIRSDKDFFFNALKERTTHHTKSVVEVETIASFNFSNVGGGDAVYCTDDDEYVCYTYHAFNHFPESFCNTRDNDWINKFNLWKSKDFLIKLADRLGLPDMMHFEIRSYIVDDKKKIFSYHNSAVQYSTDLCLVVRFV